MKDYEKQITAEFEALKKEIADDYTKMQELQKDINEKQGKLNFLRGKYQAVQDLKVDKNKPKSKTK